MIQREKIMIQNLFKENQECRKNGSFIEKQIISKTSNCNNFNFNVIKHKKKKK